ncbi:YwaF family protein [Nocardioides sambongensis]|uniref:YwaF family protein n=1 Tax=Nocardioides sambongensis TaxID=2589074 RepID=UPI00112D0082|nr:TIGR02206 family membrane protein [Nocardioides sambongensis]
MTPYGVSHLVPLAVFAVGLLVVVLLGRRPRRSRRLRVVERCWAVAIVACTVPFQLYDAATDFELGVSLPLHLCDLAWVAAAVALWTHHRIAVALTFYWGLVLTVQGLVTPSLGEDFPEGRYFAFWALHILIVWAAVHLVMDPSLRPGWPEYRATLAITLTWAGAVYVFNVVADTNYGYLRAKPSSGSLLDLLGPWPLYVALEIAIVAAVWAAMTAVLHRPAERRAAAS